MRKKTKELLMNIFVGMTIIGLVIFIGLFVLNRLAPENIDLDGIEHTGGFRIPILLILVVLGVALILVCIAYYLGKINQKEMKKW